MTIAISLKVHDGVVLAADSAATLMGSINNQPAGVFNVYNNANKVFNLFKGLPIGAITWGNGSIGTASTSTLFKDLRSRFMGADPDNQDWHVKKNNYTIEAIAQKTKEFFFDELYQKTYSNLPDQQKPTMGFIIAGYSSGEGLADEYLFQIVQGRCDNPVPIRQRDQCGLQWNGDGDAIQRLVVGFSDAMTQSLHHLGVSPEQIPLALQQLKQQLTVPLVQPAMPIQEAIELAEFLAYLTIMYARFRPGAPSVGGPIEIAAITKHEGFKWIQRKHYFDVKYNPD